MWKRVNAKNAKAGQNDLDDMFAAATKLAHAHKKLCLRRALTQVRHPVAHSRLTASRVLVKSGACSSRAFVSCLIAGERGSRSARQRVQ